MLRAAAAPARCARPLAPSSRRWVIAVCPGGLYRRGAEFRLEDIEAGLHHGNWLAGTVFVGVGGRRLIVQPGADGLVLKEQAHA